MSPKARKAVEAALIGVNGGIERYPDQFRADRGRSPNAMAWRRSRWCWAMVRTTCSTWRPGFSSHRAVPPCFPGMPSPCIRWPRCRRAPSASPRRRRTTAMIRSPCWRRSGPTRMWCGSPTPTIRPATSCRKPKCAPSSRKFRRMSRSSSTRPIPNTWHPADRADTVAWIKDFPNLLVVRTFSKIYGLAGLRIGYGVGRSEVIDLLNRVRQPFNVNNLALAGALAALDDHAFLAESYESNRRGMEQIVAGLKRLGLEHIPSHGNFVTFEVADTRCGQWQAAEAGRDRAPHRRLRHAQPPARDHRPRSGKPAFPRGPAKIALMERAGPPQVFHRRTQRRFRGRAEWRKARSSSAASG
jgi:hypothetical protein